MVFTSKGDVTGSSTKETSRQLWDAIQRQQTASRRGQCMDKDKHIHYIVHSGDFLSIESILQTYAMRLMDKSSHLSFGVENFEGDGGSWFSLLADCEEEIRNVYRKAFSANLTSPHTNSNSTDSAIGCSMLRRCGNIFLCGDGESGSKVTTKLAVKYWPASNSDVAAAGASELKRGASAASTAAPTRQKSSESTASTAASKGTQPIRPSKLKTVGSFGSTNAASTLAAAKKAASAAAVSNTDIAQEYRLMLIASLVRIGRYSRCLCYFISCVVIFPSVFV